MYQIEKFKSKGIFGGKTPVDVANEWLIFMGNSIKVIATSPIFDEDGKLLELLVTYEIDELIDTKPKKSLFWNKKKSDEKAISNPKIEADVKASESKEEELKKEELKKEELKKEELKKEEMEIDELINAQIIPVVKNISSETAEKISSSTDGNSDEYNNSNQ